MMYEEHSWRIFNISVIRTQKRKLQRKADDKAEKERPEMMRGMVKPAKNHGGPPTAVSISPLRDPIQTK